MNNRRMWNDNVQTINKWTESRQVIVGIILPGYFIFIFEDARPRLVAVVSNDVDIIGKSAHTM